MELLTQNDMARMTHVERLSLISQLWNSLENETLSLTVAQAAELDKRLDNHQAETQQGVSWADLKSELETRCP